MAGLGGGSPLELDLMNWLLAGAAVAAIVGDRADYGKPPAGRPLPRLTVYGQDGREGFTYAGRDGLRQRGFQVDAWAYDADTAQALRDAIEARLVAANAPGSGASFHAFTVTLPDYSGAADGAPGAAVPSDFFRASLDVRAWRPTA